MSAVERLIALSQVRAYEKREGGKLVHVGSYSNKVKKALSVEDLLAQTKALVEANMVKPATPPEVVKQPKAEEPHVPSPVPHVPTVAAPPKVSGKSAVNGAPMVFQEVALSEVPKYIADPKWAFQQKVDGTRGQLVIEPGKKPWFKNKNGQKMASGAGNVVGDPIVAKMPIPGEGPRYVVDGELLNGKWYVFDMAIEGQEDTPWKQRMAMADEWVKQMQKAGVPGVMSLPTARTADEKAALYDAVYKNGGEGVLMKRLDAKYEPTAKTTQMLKAKFVSTADVIVMDRNIGGKDNAEIGVYRDGKLHSVGKVTTLGKEKDGKIEVGDVLEIAYLWADPTKVSVYQPRIIRKRPDKKGFEKEQTDAQLRFVSKEVLDKAPEKVAVGGNVPLSAGRASLLYLLSADPLHDFVDWSTYDA